MILKCHLSKNIDVVDTVRFALDSSLALHLIDFFPCLYREDVKPGVSMVRRVKEAMKKEIKQKDTNVRNRQKTYKEQEKESREAALQNSISNQNKGFALLQKMGYKAGQGLGKEGKLLSTKMMVIVTSVSCSNVTFCYLFRGRES